MNRSETSCVDADAGSTDSSRRSRLGPHAGHQPEDRDQRLIEKLRSASTLQSLKAVLNEASVSWGFTDYTYTCFTRKVDVPAFLRITMPGGMGARNDIHYHDPLLTHCRERVSPIIWKADGDMRRMQVVTEAPTKGSFGYCGVSVPIHGPSDEFGIFSISSRCQDIATCASERLSMIHTAAMAVHDTAMRNCDSTRFGLQYITIDALDLAAYREQERNMNGVPAVH